MIHATQFLLPSKEDNRWYLYGYALRAPYKLRVLVLSTDENGEYFRLER